MFASVWLASLPDFAEPTILPLGAAGGVFLVETVSRFGGIDPDRRSQRALDGSYYGTLAALATYVIVNLLEVYS